MRALARVAFPITDTPHWAVHGDPLWVSATDVAVPVHAFDDPSDTILLIPRSAFVPVP